VYLLIQLMESVFCLFFSIEPVDIWNCEILLTASLDCTVRLWTMEGHFVGMPRRENPLCRLIV